MNANSIDIIKEYINKQQSPQKEILQKIRRLIKKIEPKAIECMSYGVPAFKIRNKNLLMYASFKNHIGVYPEPETIKVFKKELMGYKTTKGAIRFDLENPIPYKLIEKIIKYKIKI